MKTLSIAWKTVLTALLLLALNGCSRESQPQEIRWPELTRESQPWTRWWWHGSAVTEADITASLEAFKEAGIGGVEITPIYGVRGKEDRFLEFLSPRWMEMLIYTLQEADRLGMGVDLANTSGWPFGGPWVDAETECRYMVSKTWILTDGEALDGKIEYIQEPILRNEGPVNVTIDQIKSPVTANEDLQSFAFDQVHYPHALPLLSLTAHKVEGDGYGRTIDLTAEVQDGKLDWIAPEGEWLVCALFMGEHGKMVERAGPGGEGNVIDHFSKEALNSYLARFDEAFDGYDLSSLRYYFNDSYEVDDAIGQSNWTPAFFDEFERLNGYDLRGYIPQLIEQDSRVIYDYRMTISELLVENFTKEWQRWAARQGKGIRNQSHGSPANLIDLYAASDVPETEGYSLVGLKTAPSAAHISGKQLASSESATWLGEHFESNLGQVKESLDLMLLAGVNHIFYHGTAFSPADEPWPGWLFYAAVHFTPQNSFWEDFAALNQYIARSQGFLQSGKPANELLVYHGPADYWSEPGREYLKPYHNLLPGEEELKEQLSQRGYSWDAISDSFVKGLQYRNGFLETGGNRYSALVVPESRLMPLETFEKLLALAGQGATVIFHKQLPEGVPGMAGVGEQANKMESLRAGLEFESEGSFSIADRGKGSVVVAEVLPAILDFIGIYPEEMYKYGLQTVRRLKDDGDYYYFIHNPGQQEFAGWIPLNAGYRAVGLYNPMTGEDGYAEIREYNGRNEIYIQLRPRESLVAETMSSGKTGELYPFYRAAGEAVELAGAWELEFVKGGPTLPEKRTVNSLGSWTVYGRPYAAFSGTAEYSTTLPDLEGSDVWLLDLGTVNESASVWIDGNYIGTVINAPYSLHIPAGAAAPGARLTVRVSNLMANRIADMDKRGERWQIFYNTNINSRRPENRDAQGDFTAAGWQFRASGLAGPVTLTPLGRVN
ncbi:MAG: glycoside hydrolase family 2 protein [Rikenellaceae bacterium]|nr:glycoside hydrolase family 2 protein [Rikenellaceae bacterium]